MNREEKLEVFKEAVKLADSGKYKDWEQIQSQLLKSGKKTSAGVARREKDTDDSGRSVYAGHFSKVGIGSGS